MKLKKVFFGFVDLLLAGLWSLSIAAGPPDGKILFQKKICYACHGKEGQGGPSGPPLKNLGKGKKELVDFLKKGSPKMRPVKAGDEELSALADYILSLK